MPATRKHIVIGVIENDQGEIFIAQRQQGQHLSGYWELPGGKREPDESAFDALARELDEELGIQVLTADPLCHFDWDYPDTQTHLHLDFWRVNQYAGTPHGKEGQPVKWVARTKLNPADFPEANQQVIQQLKDYKVDM